MLKKDIATIDLLFEEASPDLRENALFKAEYARALLSCGDYYSGMRMVKEYVQKGYFSNTVSNLLLEGLSEGGYDEECLQLYRRLEDQSKAREFEKEPMHLLVHGYSAVIRSLCHLKKRESATALFEEMRAKGLKPLPFVFFELCEVRAVVWRETQLAENRQEWRKRLEDVESRLISRQVFLTSDE